MTVIFYRANTTICARISDTTISKNKIIADAGQNSDRGRRDACRSVSN